MKNLKDLLKNKFVLTAVSISLFVLLLVLLLSPKKNVKSPLPSNSTPLTTSSFELVDLSKEKRDATMIYVASIENKLPLSLEKFETSVGIITGINIYQGKNDPAELVRLEISGLSYINKNELDEKKNPNVTAFKESFLKAIEMLESQNIDPKQLVFYYSNQDYIRQTAREWVDKLKLLP
jgi:hypothetical protein